MEFEYGKNSYSFVLSLNLLSVCLFLRFFLLFSDWSDHIDLGNASILGVDVSLEMQKGLETIWGQKREQAES